MGDLSTRLARLERRLPADRHDPRSDAYLWAALNDAESFDLLDQYLVAHVEGDMAAAAAINVQIDARLEAIAEGRA